MWAELEKASKRAVTPSSVVAEVNLACESIPMDAVAAAVELSSLSPLLAEDVAFVLCESLGCVMSVTIDGVGHKGAHRPRHCCQRVFEGFAPDRGGIYGEAGQAPGVSLNCGAWIVIIVCQVLR